MMIEKIIEALIVSGILGLLISLVGFLINSKLTKIDKGQQDLSEKITGIQIELPNKYLKISEFKDFKEENRVAHKELREEMNKKRKEIENG